MQGLNRIQIIGNVGNDPAVQYTQNQTAVLRLRIAVSERVKRGDDFEDHTEWFNVSVFGKRAEGLQKVLRKGSAVMVEGPVRQRKYEDKNGAQRDALDVYADNVILLGGDRGERDERAEGRATDERRDDRSAAARPGAVVSATNAAAAAARAQGSSPARDEPAAPPRGGQGYRGRY